MGVNFQRIREDILLQFKNWVKWKLLANEFTREYCFPFASVFQQNYLCNDYKKHGTNAYFQSHHIQNLKQDIENIHNPNGFDVEDPIDLNGFEKEHVDYAYHENLSQIKDN
jgi:hypothetical protein